MQGSYLGGYAINQIKYNGDLNQGRDGGGQNEQVMNISQRLT